MGVQAGQIGVAGTSTPALPLDDYRMRTSLRVMPMGYKPVMTGLVPVIHVVSLNSRRAGATELPADPVHNGRRTCPNASLHGRRG